MVHYPSRNADYIRLAKRISFQAYRLINFIFENFRIISISMHVKYSTLIKRAMFYPYPFSLYDREKGFYLQPNVFNVVEQQQQ